MSPVLGVFGAVREFFALQQPERAIVAYRPAQLSQVRRHVEAGRARLAASRRITGDVAASALLLEAVRHYLMALRAATTEDGTQGAEADLLQVLPPLRPDPERPDAAPTDDERVRSALAARDPLHLDGMSPEDAVHTRGALTRAAALLSDRVETRSLANIRATRWGRAAAAVVLVLYCAWATVAAVWLPHNVARGKPVHPSSSRRGDGSELVDGELSPAPGLLTGTEDSPSVVIDLQDLYVLHDIRVYNRQDHSFDDCLPLAVEVSTDGVSYKQLGRRDQHFGADPPWIVDGRREIARYVRVKVLRRSYLALAEVEVYGRLLPAKQRPAPPGARK